MKKNPPEQAAGPNWLEINLSAVEHNTRVLLERTGVAMMAVVKANAYGMGAVPIAKTILKCGATALAVARFSEAAALRSAGITAPILVFGMVTSGEVDAAIHQGVWLTLHSRESAELFSQRARAAGLPARVHLKIDTGMGRLGVMAEEAGALAAYALNLGNIQVEGIYTHFSMIDDRPDDPLAPVQLARFNQAVAAVREVGINPAWLHMANSAAAMGWAPSYQTMTRPGSVLVGIRPFYFLPFPPELRRVLTWKVRLASCRTLPAGWGISYGQTYHTQTEEIIGVLPVGYADGFRRVDNNEVLIDGQRVPVVGRVCADACMVRLPRVYPEGTEVVLLGRQGLEAIEIEDLSSRWKISQADVTASINSRVERIYLTD
jgi:alanine racemase